MCNSPDSRVLESRLIEEDTTLRRRRDCAGCGKRFTTYERVETVPLMISKRDGTREPFDPRKLATGLMRACVKSDVSLEAIERIVAEIEADLHRRHTREVPSQEIGEMTLARLRDLDEVAYVRFASVYRNFTGIEDFIHELKTLQAAALSR
jgi:transcriptional repressor NrdR